MVIHKSGARHGSARQNICSERRFSWLENRADISRADIPYLIVLSFMKFSICYKELEKVQDNRAVHAVQIYGSCGNLKFFSDFYELICSVIFSS